MSNVKDSNVYDDCLPKKYWNNLYSVVIDGKIMGSWMGHDIFGHTVCHAIKTLESIQMTNYSVTSFEMTYDLHKVYVKKIGEI